MADIHQSVQIIISFSLAWARCIPNIRFSPKYDAGNMTMDPRFFELLGSLLFVKKNPS